jgi:hypothetical protein
MKPQDVLLHLLNENDYYIRDILDTVPIEGLSWQPDEVANSLGVQIWHVARAHDVFFTQHVKGLEAAHEIWFADSWAERSGYDPRGLGTNGWGMLTGYTEEEAASIPAMDADVLRGYYNAVSGTIRAYLSETTVEELEAAAPGYEGKQTNWFWVRHPLFDMTRHVGEMLMLKGLWERQTHQPAKE